MHYHADLLIHFEVAKARFHTQSNFLSETSSQTGLYLYGSFITTVIFPRISNIFSFL